MSTIPPGLPAGTQLDGPPPAPGGIPVGPPQSGFSGLGNPGEDPAKKAMQGLAEAFQTVDQVLLTAASSMPEASEEFGAARKLIEQGLAKGLAAMGQNPEVSTTNAGNQFPGGGFSSVGGGIGG